MRDSLGGGARWLPAAAAIYRGRAMPRSLRSRPAVAVLLSTLLIAGGLAAAAGWPASAVHGEGRALPRPVVSHVREPLPHRAGPPAIQQVVASPPVAFTLTGPRFTIKARVCSMANVRPYDPPGEQHHTVCWVRSGFGVAPGTNQGTSYLFGHSWAEDAREVLNKASALATAEILHARAREVPSSQPKSIWGPTTTVFPVHALDGHRIVLRTHTAVLTYEVRRAYGVDKHYLGLVADWSDPSPGDRVVLTTCAELDGVDYDDNVVLDAYLVAARPLAG
jgi:hypothetical protein